MPQPIPYQGSKRNIAHHILAVMPPGINTLVEPFAGSAAVSVAAAYYRKAERFHLNDSNQPLMALLKAIIDTPDEIASAYERLWKSQLGRRREFYDEVRDKFNRTHSPDLLLYLLARCVKASVRYNSTGEFNQSPDNRRRGRRPESMRDEIKAVSSLLRGRTTVTCEDYKETFNVISANDLVYMDPPYQGTSGKRDARYLGGVDMEELVEFLQLLNDHQVMYILSYDGRRGNKSYGKQLPSNLDLQHLEIKAGRSTQSTLLGGKDITYESLYLSPALVARLRKSPHGKRDELNNARIQARICQPKQLELGI